MANTTNGYVRTVRVSGRRAQRVWCSLAESPGTSEWVHIASKRAWFFIPISGGENQTVRMAQYTLLLESLRSGLKVRIYHQGASDTVTYNSPQDSFEVDDVRIFGD